MIIDAVITWVDGNDPKHLAKRNQIIDKRDVRNQKEASERLDSINEIRYCVESIIRFAPFIRTIFIVTDDQVPSIYHDYPDRIKIIDHKEIFIDHEYALPTINIFSIECMLYRIKDLAEHFIYLNDDFFLIKPTQPEDWFINDLPVLRGRWETPPDKIWYKKIKRLISLNDPSHAGFRNSQALAAQLAGFTDRFFRCFHTPRSLRKSTFEHYFSEHPDLLKHQIQYRLRNPTQFNPYALAWHLEIKNKTAQFSTSIGILELHNPANKAVRTIRNMLKKVSAQPEIICANVQSLNLASKEKQQLIFAWLEDTLRCE